MPDVIGSLLGGIGFGGNAIGAAIVRLRLDSDDYQRQLAATHGQTDVAAKSMGASTSKFAGLAKAAFLSVGAAAVGGIAIAIKAGSDLNEQVNKSREVFGAASASVIKFSENTASSLGIAQAEALTAAGNFGQLFDSAGFVSEAAADMSVKMVQLGADLGSFNNIPVAEALEKIRAGLAGEAEPLRQLGVFLSEARVETEAYTSGLAEQGAELTTAQKIQARYNIILADTNKAQGDFARTVGESLPNQLKVMKAELIDVAANLGTVLLPVALEVVRVLKSVLVPALKFAADNLGLIVGALAAFATVRFLPELLFKIALGLEAVGAASIANAVLNVGAAVSSLASAGGLLLAAFAGIPVAAYKVVQAIAPVEEAMKRLNEEAKGFNGVHGPGMERGLEAIREKLNPLPDAFERVGHMIRHTFRQAGDTVEETKERIKNFANLTNKELRDWRRDMGDSFESFNLALEESQDVVATTRFGFLAATASMKADARDLAQAMRLIAREKWVNDEYIAFLSEQGPQWLIGFSKLTEEQQRKAQEAWKVTTEKTDQAKESLDKITGVLDKMNKGESRHKVVIEYEYVGFDPTKPGMLTGGQKTPSAPPKPEPTHFGLR